MPYRQFTNRWSPNRWKLTARIDEVKNIADKFLRSSPALADQLTAAKKEISTFARQPRALGAWIESRSPWLNRRFLGVASNLAEPFTAGMGLKVAKLGEDCSEVSLPDSWRNLGSAGTIHTAALAVLGEMSARIFWEHHLDLRASDVSLKRVQVRLLATPKGDMRGTYRIPVAEREAILLRLRADGHAEFETQTLVYDGGGRLIAEVDADLELHRQLALGSKAEPS